VSAPRAGWASGFSLVEVLIATAIVVAVAGLVSALAIDAQATWRVENARIDLQQRSRVVSDVIRRALAAAGDVAHAGPGFVAATLPVIVPRRVGRRSADPPTAVRSDLFTVVRAATDVEPGLLSTPLPSGATSMVLGGCAIPACGFAPGMTVLLTAGSGNYDLFTTVAVADSVLTVRHHGTGLHAGYPAGSAILAALSETYYVDADERVLRRYDGDSVDVPVADDVVGMEVEYYGGVGPPVRSPPADGIETCLFEDDGSYRTVLLPALQGSESFVRLGRERLQDGPWCGSGGTAFDADLLRALRVRVRVRLQAADPSVRGADPVRFQVPGFAVDSARLVADATAVIDVVFRNSRSGW
jgi:type II secretory pathway pseudopilin PulG